MLWSVAAFAGPLYNNDEVALELGGARRADLMALVRDKLTEHHAQVEQPLKTLTTSELTGLVVAASTPERGGEFDLLLGDDRVTVWEEGSVWRVQRVPNRQTRTSGLSMEQLVKTYDLGTMSVENGARWEPAATAAVRGALEVLTPEERAFLANVRWVRRPRPTRAMSTTGLHAATYIVDDADARIEVYDDTLVPTTRFVGPLDRPSTPATAVILHEMGHAIADAPLRALAADYERQRLAHDAGRKQLETDLAVHNQAIDRFNKTRNAALGQSLERDGPRIRAEAQRLNERAAQLAVARAAMEGGQQVSPMARLFAEEVGGTATAYARHTPDEAFAEAFALYHLDPDALERAQPGALAWFRAGRHVAAP